MEPKNKIIALKILLEGFNSRLDQAEERKKKLESKVIENNLVRGAIKE